MNENSSQTRPNTVVVIIEKTRTGYSSYSNDVLGCIATGDTLEEVKIRMESAIKAHHEFLIEFNDEIPLKLQDSQGYELMFHLDF